MFGFNKTTEEAEQAAGPETVGAATPGRGEPNPEAASTDASTATSIVQPVGAVHIDGPLTVSPAVPAQQLGQDTSGRWTPFEIVDGVTQPVRAGYDTPPGVHLLDRARALPELAKEEAAHLIAEGIQAFKDLEGRTMRVVHRAGELFKQELHHGE